MNTEWFFFLITGNLGQWRTKKIDRNYEDWIRQSSGVGDNCLGRVIKSDLRLGFPLSNLHQRDKLVCNLAIHVLKNFPWHSRPIFYFKPGQTINTPNVKERLFTDMMSLWALGNSTTGLTQSSLSAVFNGNSRLSSVAVTTLGTLSKSLRLALIRLPEVNFLQKWDTAHVRRLHPAVAWNLTTFVGCFAVRS